MRRSVMDEQVTKVHPSAHPSAAAPTQGEGEYSNRQSTHNFTYTAYCIALAMCSAVLTILLYVDFFYTDNLMTFAEPKHRLTSSLVTLLRLHQTFPSNRTTTLGIYPSPLLPI